MISEAVAGHRESHVFHLRSCPTICMCSREYAISLPQSRQHTYAWPNWFWWGHVVWECTQSNKQAQIHLSTFIFPLRHRDRSKHAGNGISSYLQRGQLQVRFSQLCVILLFANPRHCRGSVNAEAEHVM